jgi:hypothetical protein
MQMDIWDQGICTHIHHLYLYSHRKTGLCYTSLLAIHSFEILGHTMPFDRRFEYSACAISRVR